jgi:hypothetical protein
MVVVYFCAKKARTFNEKTAKLLVKSNFAMRVCKYVIFPSKGKTFQKKNMNPSAAVFFKVSRI